MNLSIHQATAFTEFAQASIQVKDEAGFIALVNQHVKPLLPHGMLLAVIGSLHFDHLHVHHHIAMGYAKEALSLLTRPIHIRDRPLLQQWLHARMPVIACPVADRDVMSTYEQFENQALGLGRVALHGLPDLTNRMGSYFSFAQVPSDWASEVISQHLCIMVPLLHTALIQVFRLPASDAGVPPLTGIECELLVCLAAGRSNQEIAAMRQRSVATIRNQLVGLYVKLNVSNRAEAAMVAMRQAQIISAPKRVQ